MKLYELVNDVNVQGDGEIRLYPEEMEGDYKVLFDWEMDLLGIPEAIEDLEIDYMYCIDGRMVIEVKGD